MKKKKTTALVANSTITQQKNDGNNIFYISGSRLTGREDSVVIVA
jgi:hypothetical protein